MIKKILVPLDGSERSDKALDFAINLAKSQNGKLTLFHVVDRKIPDELRRVLKPSKDIESTRTLEPILGPSSPHIEVENVLKKWTELAGKDIFEKAAEKARSNDVEFESLSYAGDLAHEISKTLKSEAFDLVIIGSTGIGKVEQFLFGGVTEEVARNSPCTVTIVR